MKTGMRFLWCACTWVGAGLAGLNLDAWTLEGA